jgi:hypothetical protein
MNPFSFGDGEPPSLPRISLCYIPFIAEVARVTLLRKLSFSKESRGR